MITVRRMTGSDRTSAQKLWQTVFGDDPAFLEWYFQTRFDPDRSFGVFSDGTLLSMALGRKVFLSVGREAVAAWLVAGVCTVPAYRKQGWMHRVMRAMEQAAREDAEWLCLRPVASEIYRSLGYRDAMTAKLVASKDCQMRSSVTVSEREELVSMLRVYRSVQEQQNGMVIRDEREQNRVLEEYRMEEGRTLLCESGGEVIGYSILVKREGGWQIAEQLAVSDEAHESLLAYAERLLKTQELKAELPCGTALIGTKQNTLQILPLNDRPIGTELYCLGDY